MRKKGSVFALSSNRNRDLLRAYRELISMQLSLYGRITPTGLMSRLVNSPASRYWVSSERACSIMLRMEKGESICHMKSHTVRFYQSLYKEFCAYKQAHPEMPAKHIVEIIVQLPAPCFVLSPRVAGNIIYKMKEECRKERMKKSQS